MASDFERWTITRLKLKVWCEEYDNYCRDAISYLSDKCRKCYEKWEAKKDLKTKRN